MVVWSGVRGLTFSESSVHARGRKFEQVGAYFPEICTGQRPLSSERRAGEQYM